MDGPGWRDQQVWAPLFVSFHHLFQQHKPGMGAYGMDACPSAHHIVIAWAGETFMRAIFVMIKCEMGQAYRVAREMADTIPQLSEMHSVSGQYDLLGKFYLELDQDIGLFVVEKVQSVAGVKDTYTLQTFNAFSGSAG
jgi:DNA-binding Lrp family transcriptional regulator